jgi:hypothetical protein
MNTNSDQSRFKARFETYLDQRIPKKPFSNNNSYSGDFHGPIRIEHYYHDAWWYFPTPRWPTQIHNHYYESKNRNVDENNNQQMQKQNKNKVNLDNILKGVFVGSVLVGSSYVLFNSYLDWYDEKCLLEDIKLYKNSEDLDHQNLYNVGKYVLKKNCNYSRDIFFTKLGLIGSGCLLLLDYNYWENENIMNACLVGATLTGLFGIVRYTLFNRYSNDEFTKNSYSSLKNIIQNDNKVHPPDY